MRFACSLALASISIFTFPQKASDRFLRSARIGPPTSANWSNRGPCLSGQA